MCNPHTEACRRSLRSLSESSKKRGDDFDHEIWVVLVLQLLRLRVNWPSKSLQKKSNHRIGMDLERRNPLKKEIIDRGCLMKSAEVDRPTVAQRNVHLSLSLVQQSFGDSTKDLTPSSGVERSISGE
ncbi:hypothetical protein HPP92_027862 [Vanilla planifolia]|uniref:Uncharacterized protein n=1 Tax=Vanilla planifolia TaxID=51239 RepID=A0A835PAU5_VANPL|nr:hypothetical protein HPP92_027862 [Vanilla planifolia]